MFDKLTTNFYFILNESSEQKRFNTNQISCVHQNVYVVYLISNSVVKKNGKALAISVALLLSGEELGVLVGLLASLHFEGQSTSDTSANRRNALT